LDSQLIAKSKLMFLSPNEVALPVIIAQKILERPTFSL
jgi:hypothetical protein